MPVLKTFIQNAATAILFTAIMGLVSCKAPKDLVYFQNISRDTTLQNTVSKNFNLKIKPDDLLYVGVTSASAEQSALFNAPQIATVSGTTGSSPTSGYLVDRSGNIQVYKLGDVPVAGLTRVELKEKLQKDLSPYLKDPVVTVRFLNQRVTVLGEVAKPGVLPMATDQISILEAIGQSGDLTTYGRRDNVLVIRQTESGKELKTVNLLDKSVFTSPYYYLQNEDVVYIEPDVKRKTGTNAQTISFILSGVSIISILLTRLIR
jgi:polysaccharide biosynthesis/export protein